MIGVFACSTLGMRQLSEKKHMRDKVLHLSLVTDKGLSFTMGKKNN